MKSGWTTFLMIFLIISCNKNDDDNLIACEPSIKCDKCILIDRDLYLQTNTDGYTITNIQIDQDCLEIEFASSGCDGSSWEIDLVDLGAISETAVPQRDLKLKLINLEDCEAYITKTISFDLKPLRLLNSEAVNLKITNYNNLIRYEY